ncbi:MAG: hypothetical protein WCC00_02930 [Candidatus Aminicenantales bacterium]
MSVAINKQVIFKFMREALRQSGPSNDCGRLMTSALGLMAGARLIEVPPNRQLSDIYSGEFQKGSAVARWLSECYNEFFLHGILIGKLSLYEHGNLSSYVLTEYGQAWIQREDDPIPEDRIGYISYLRGAITKIDAVIIQYISEALNTYKADCYFASAVMLGAAAEKLLYLLADSIINSIQDAKTKADLSKSMKFRDLSALRAKVIKILSLDNLKQSRIPYEVHEDSSEAFFSILNAIRVQRNDAVHPIANKISQSELRLHLYSFPSACKKAYDIIQWLNVNPL